MTNTGNLYRSLPVMRVLWGSIVGISLEHSQDTSRHQELLQTGWFCEVQWIGFKDFSGTSRGNQFFPTKQTPNHSIETLHWNLYPMVVKHGWQCEIPQLNGHFHRASSSWMRDFPANPCSVPKGSQRYIPFIYWCSCFIMFYHSSAMMMI